MRNKIIIIFSVVSLVCTGIGYCVSHINADKKSESTAASSQTVLTANEEKNTTESIELTSDGTAESSTTEKATDKETKTTAKKAESASSATKKDNSNQGDTVSATKAPSATTKAPPATTKPTTTTTTTQAKQEISVTISIDSFVSNYSVTIKEGGTVFDALSTACKENGLSLKYKSKSYIEGIGGLEADSSHGWTYYVNGDFPSKPASSYKLTNGDKIEWKYVTVGNVY